MPVKFVRGIYQTRVKSTLFYTERHWLEPNRSGAMKTGQVEFQGYILGLLSRVESFKMYTTWIKPLQSSNWGVIIQMPPLCNVGVGSLNFEWLSGRPIFLFHLHDFRKTYLFYLSFAPVWSGVFAFLKYHPGRNLVESQQTDILPLLAKITTEFISQDGR